MTAAQRRATASRMGTGAMTGAVGSRMGTGMMGEMKEALTETLVKKMRAKFGAEDIAIQDIIGEDVCAHSHPYRYIKPPPSSLVCFKGASLHQRATVYIKHAYAPQLRSVS